ncbi:hypothetical protein [Actinocorallia longicatena]|uniref:Uncharacterized protein n=1 Tax=Actinocorallia longicatena TaxID=111803 RepID=A0ABP6Q6T6_9ACTN
MRTVLLHHNPLLRYGALFLGLGAAGMAIGWIADDLSPHSGIE